LFKAAWFGSGFQPVKQPERQPFVAHFGHDDLCDSIEQRVELLVRNRVGSASRVAIRGPALQPPLGDAPLLGILRCLVQASHVVHFDAGGRTQHLPREHRVVRHFSS
jgi:hypothetical protein